MAWRSRRYSTNGSNILMVAELDTIAPICNSHLLQRKSLGIVIQI